MQVANLSLAWQTKKKKGGSYHQDHARPFQIALTYTYSWQRLVNSAKRLGNGTCTQFTSMMQLIDHT